MIDAIVSVASLSSRSISAMRDEDTAALLSIAEQFLAHKEPRRAEMCLQAVIAIDPELTAAREALADVYEETGRVFEAGQQRELAYMKNWCIIDRAQSPAAEATLLLAVYKAGGQIRTSHLLPIERFTKIRYMLDYARPDKQFELPAHDVVLNMQGDPDWLAADDHRLAELARRSGRPVLNAPRAAWLTRRDLLPERLTNIEGIDVPAVHRIEPAQARSLGVVGELARRNATYPLLVRSARTHGGDSVVLASQPSDLAQAELPAKNVVYATEYRDYRSLDGYYRKYRVMFIDRCLYPYHLAISKRWLVHYFSAEMAAEPWKLDEEYRFLKDPVGVLGPKAWRALEQIAERLDLDYAGIDFSILPEGTVLVFEANATMFVHPEEAGGVLSYKNQAVDAIVRAFGEMILRHRGPASARSPC